MESIQTREKTEKKKILKHDQNICEMQDPYQVV